MINGNKVSSLVCKYTKCNDGKNSLNITLDRLICLINDIIAVGETTEFIFITPFYENAKKRGFIPEFELLEFDFYIECRDHVSKAEEKEFLAEYMNAESPRPKSLENQRFLCGYTDSKYFAECLTKYKDYLIKSIPEMHKEVGKLLNNDIDVLKFGCICFEVICE